MTSFALSSNLHTIKMPKNLHCNENGNEQIEQQQTTAILVFYLNLFFNLLFFRNARFVKSNWNSKLFIESIYFQIW